jgi:hypothetical protein
MIKSILITQEEESISISGESIKDLRTSDLQLQLTPSGVSYMVDSLHITVHKGTKKPRLDRVKTVTIITYK